MLPPKFQGATARHFYIIIPYPPARVNRISSFCKILPRRQNKNRPRPGASRARRRLAIPAFFGHTRRGTALLPRGSGVPRARGKRKRTKRRPRANRRPGGRFRGGGSRLFFGFYSTSEMVTTNLPRVTFRHPFLFYSIIPIFAPVSMAFASGFAISMLGVPRPPAQPRNSNAYTSASVRNSSIRTGFPARRARPPSKRTRLSALSPNVSQDTARVPSRAVSVTTTNP